MARGDVVRVQLPRPDSSNPTRLQRGTRPAVIVQSDKYPSASVVLIVPATTNLDAMNFPGSVLVKPDGTNGLTQSSVFMVHQLGAVELSIIASKIGHLSSADIEAVEQSIIRLVDLGVSPPAALPSSLNDEKDSNTG